MQTLTPVQEAQLDVACYPWCPDVWNLASILAAKHGDDTPDTIRSDANNAVVPAASLVPQHCTAEMLALPLLAHGYGLQLKRESVLEARDSSIGSKVDRTQHLAYEEAAN